MIFNALVRSHLDYGSILFKPASQACLNKLDMLFFKGLRVSLGCMNSSPRLALLAEATELDLEHRRKLLATKFLSKVITIQQHPLVISLGKLRKSLITKPDYYRGHNIPHLVEALDLFSPFFKNIYKSSNFPCHDLDYKILTHNLPYFDCKIAKNELMIKEKFMLVTNKYSDDFFFVFKDASKVKEWNLE